MTGKKGSKKKYVPRKEKAKAREAEKPVRSAPKIVSGYHYSYPYCDNDPNDIAVSAQEFQMLGLLIEDLQVELLDDQTNDYWCALFRNLLLLNIIFAIFPFIQPQTPITEDMLKLLRNAISAEKKIASVTETLDEYEIGVLKFIMYIKEKQNAAVQERNAHEEDARHRDLGEGSLLHRQEEEPIPEKPIEDEDCTSSAETNLLKFIPPGIRLQDVIPVPVRCDQEWRSERFLHRKQCLHDIIYSLHPDAPTEEVLDRVTRKVVLTALRIESSEFETARSWPGYLASIDRFVCQRREKKSLEAESKREIKYRQSDEPREGKDAEKEDSPSYDHPIEAEFTEENGKLDVATEVNEIYPESGDKYASDDDPMDSETNSCVTSQSGTSTETGGESSNALSATSYQIVLGTVTAKPAQPTKKWQSSFPHEIRQAFIQELLRKIYPHVSPEAILHPESILVYTFARATEYAAFKSSKTATKYRAKLDDISATLFAWCEKYRNLRVALHVEDFEDESNFIHGPQPVYPNDFYFELTRQHLQLLLHADICKVGDTTKFGCPNPHCQSMKKVIRQMRECPDEYECMAPHCSSTRQLIEHWSACFEPTCPICIPLLFKERFESMFY